MRHKTRLILLFYRSWAFLSNLITAVCAWLVVKTSILTLPGILFLKLAILALILYFMHRYGNKTIYYYTNLGVAPKVLWGWSVAFDLIIFSICITAAAIFRLSLVV